MTIIPMHCWNCNNPISDADKKCVHCGKSQDNWFEKRQQKLAEPAQTNEREFVACPPPRLENNFPGLLEGDSK